MQCTIFGKGKWRWILLVITTLLQIEFYGDFDGSFHKKLDLMVDLSAALLGHRSHRYFFCLSASFNPSSRNWCLLTRSCEGGRLMWSMERLKLSMWKKHLLISRFLVEMSFSDRSNVRFITRRFSSLFIILALWFEPQLVYYLQGFWIRVGIDGRW